MKARIIEIEPYFKGLYNINFGDIYPVVRTSISGEHKNKKAHLIKTKKGDYLTMYDHQVELLK